MEDWSSWHAKATLALKSTGFAWKKGRIHSELQANGQESESAPSIVKSEQALGVAVHKKGLQQPKKTA